MAFVNLNAYTADVIIPEFRGIYRPDSMDTAADEDLRYAEETTGADFTGGRLQPLPDIRNSFAFDMYFGMIFDRSDYNPPSTSVFDETKVAGNCVIPFDLHWNATESGSRAYLFCTNAAVVGNHPDDWKYTYQNAYYFVYQDPSTNKSVVPLPSGVDHFELSRWSYVSYEYTPQGASQPVDVLILTNEVDGMFMLRADTLTMTRINAPAKFSSIAMYSERIWGCGAKNDPDMLYYCRPYDPTNWAADTQYPERGAGVIRQPSWDGDAFVKLYSFGSALIALKKKTVWRISGSSPSDYYVTKQMGPGTVAAFTVCDYNGYMYYLAESGLVRFDGSVATPFQQEAVKNLLSRTNEGVDAKKLYQACACVFNDALYLSVTKKGSKWNNEVLVYSFINGSWSVFENMCAVGFMPDYEYGKSAKRGLLFTHVCLAPYSKYPAGILKAAYITPCFLTSSLYDYSLNEGPQATEANYDLRWVSKWVELRLKRKALEEIVLYFTPYVSEKARYSYPEGSTSEDPIVKFTIETDHGVKKTKTITLTEAMSGRQQRLHYKCHGTRFRLIIEHDARNVYYTDRYPPTEDSFITDAPKESYPALFVFMEGHNRQWWCIKDGIHMVVDTSEIDG